MDIFIRVFGPEIFPKQKISLKKSAPAVKDAASHLLNRHSADWRQIIADDLMPAEGYTVLLNGRNIQSLEGLNTPLADGDELIFTVMVMGG